MKRHKSLIPLSHDHHNGLMVAQLIKSGAPEYEGLPTTLSGKIDYLKEFFNNELKIHFENEESILFPFVMGEDKEIDSLVNELLDEHKSIIFLIDSIESEKEKESLLDRIGKELELHIRKEERILFQKIQLKFENTLDKLEGKILPAKNSCK